ncbi:MAG: MBL fold metallo-hydrolase [Candidatus Bipolaricaulota bacterium]
MKTLSLVLATCGLVAAGALANEVSVDYLGHSCFALNEEAGPVIVIDPYADYLPYPALPRAADVVLITHGHIDHCPYCFGQQERVSGDPTIVWPFDAQGQVREGTWKIADGLSVRFIEASHVTASGGGEGLVTLFSFALGGIQFAHLGDLGRLLTPEQVAALGAVQVLFVPVGGAYTIGAAEAVAVVKQLPTVRIVIPMHFFVDEYCPWPDMAPADGFLSLAEEEGWSVRRPASSRVGLEPETLPEAVEVWLLPFAIE